MSLSADVEVRRGALGLAVALEVASGEVVALLGPNGAGKSTLLRVLAGLLAVDSGRVVLDEVVLDDPDRGVFVEPERRSVGLVVQDFALFAHMSVLENVAFGMRARGVRAGEARRRAGEWLERVGVDAYSSQRPGVLSGGQAQRVALARALAPSPRLLLLDEPLAALDVATRATVRRDLRGHLDAVDGVRLLVTHDPVDAHALADRVVVIEGGRVVQEGTLADVTARPRSRYVAELVGVNLLSGSVHNGVLVTDQGASIVVVGAPAGRVHAVIRPHSVALSSVAPTRTSARNSWPGRVVDVVRLGDRARVRLDGAVPLTAEITAAALDDLALRPGDEVHATVKATDVEVSPA